MLTVRKRLSMKVVAGLLSATLAGATLALTQVGGPATAALATTTSRIGGANRYDTARLAALAKFPAGSANAVLASGENFPDGLAAADLAGAIGAPLLLTPAASLAGETVSALAALHVHTVYVVGGSAAVSAAVIASLQSLGYTVPTATAGADRYATAAAVATAAATSATVGTLGGLKTAILATGANFPDALAAGAVSYANHLPILLTDPLTLSTAAATAITSLGVQQVLIMGGTAAVSAAVETAVQALKVGGVGAAVTTIRIAGATRADTAAQLATKEITPIISGGFGFGLGNVVLASGVNFPDALDAAEFGAPIILDGSAGLPAETTAWLGTNGASIGNIQAQGGTTAVPAADLTGAYNASAPTGGTATIAAQAGGVSFTVTFSMPVVTTGIATTAFTLNNGALPGGSAVVVQSATSLLVTLNGHVLASGDVIGLVAGAITGTNGNPVGAASLTVGTAATFSVVSTQFYASTVPLSAGVLGGAIAHKWGPWISITFSNPVNVAYAGTAGFANSALNMANYTLTNGAGAVLALGHGGNCGYATPPAPTCTNQTSGAGRPYTVTAGAITDAVVSADGLTVTIPVPPSAAYLADAFTVTSAYAIDPAASLTIHNTIQNKTGAALATTTVLPQHNSVASTVTTAKSSVTGYKQGAVVVTGMAGGDALTISAKPGSALSDGALGATFKVQTAYAAQPAVTAVPTTVAGVTTVLVTIPTGAGVYTSGPALAAALNANSTFASVLVANGTGATDTSTGAPMAATTLAGGETDYAVAASFTRPVVPSEDTLTSAAAGTWSTVFTGTGAGCACDGDAVSVAPDNVAAPQVLTIVFHITNPAHLLTPGTSGLVFYDPSPEADFAGNSFDPNPAAPTAFLIT